MNRYYSDSNDAYYASHQQSNNIRASGWQSPLPSTDITPSLSSTLIRIVVPCPFGSKKCDYTIDKSQQGRLNITARRRHTFKSDYLLLNNKNNTAIQTFLIPNDADVDHLQSHIERYTNRLIIQMPRLHPTYTNLIRSPNIFASAIGTTPLIRDDTKYIRKHADNNRKLEYRVDCRGYTSDELDVFIQGRDLIVQGKTKRATSPDPTGQHVSKNFSRKISLPNTVDLSRIVSYLENGELRIEAPLKRDIHYRDEKILSPELSSTVVGNRTVGEFTRVQSPTPGQQQYHYRRHQRVSRHQGDDHRPQSPTRRIHSAESHHYPYYRSPRDLDEDDARDTRHRRTVNYERYSTNQNDIEQVPIHRSNYSPGNNVVTTRTTYHNHPMEDDTSFNY